jgi:hypothetical protein
MDAGKRQHCALLVTKLSIHREGARFINARNCLFPNLKPNCALLVTTLSINRGKHDLLMRRSAVS